VDVRKLVFVQFLDRGCDRGRPTFEMTGTICSSAAVARPLASAAFFLVTMRRSLKDE